MALVADADHRVLVERNVARGVPSCAARVAHRRALRSACLVDARTERAVAADEPDLRVAPLADRDLEVVRARRSVSGRLAAVNACPKSQHNEQGSHSHTVSRVQCGCQVPHDAAPEAV